MRTADSLWVRLVDVPAALGARAYTFDDHELLAVLHEIGDDVTTAMLVGHNPALDDLVAAACTLFVIAPLLVTFLIFQKRFISSFVTSGIK